MNSASFNLCGLALTPEILRDLADKIEASIDELKRAKK